MSGEPAGPAWLVALRWEAPAGWVPPDGGVVARVVGRRRGLSVVATEFDGGVYGVRVQANRPRAVAALEAVLVALLDVEPAIPLSRSVFVLVEPVS